jgi:uncharacterized protein YajQ (UPF0234 family)
MSDIISNFGRNVNQLNPLTQLGQGFNQVQQQRQAQEQALLQQQAQQQQAQQLNDAYGLLQSGNATAQDYANLAMMLPKDKSEALRKSFEILTQDEQTNTLNQTGQIFSSFKSGRADIAAGLIDQFATAYENSGDENNARLMRKWSEVAKSGDEGARQAESYFGFIMSQIPGGTDVIDSAIKLGGESRTAELQPGVVKQQLLDAGYKEAQTNKLLVETKKLENEIGAALDKNNGILTRDEKVKYQDNIRTEWLKNTTSARDAQTKLNKIEAVSNRAINADGGVKGVADLALVNSFQRLIDDGVVKGEDVKLAMETAGKGSQLYNTWDLFTKGSKLTNDQRREFVQVAELLNEAELKSVETMKNVYRNTIKKSGLDENEIFGGDTVTETTVTVTPELTALQDQILQWNEDAKPEDIKNMTEEEIKASYPGGYKYYQENIVSSNGTESNVIEVDF